MLLPPDAQDPWQLQILNVLNLLRRDLGAAVVSRIRDSSSLVHRFSSTCNRQRTRRSLFSLPVTAIDDVTG